MSDAARDFILSSLVPQPSSPEDGPYRPKDAIGESTSAAIKVGTVGAVFSGIQATLTKQNIGPFGAITKYGTTTALFAATGASYMFVRHVTSNLREKDDWKSSALGGFAAGSIVGITRRNIPAVLGFGALTALMTGMMTLGGGRLWGHQMDIYADRVQEKEDVRKRYRVPIEQTIAELGEGRGIRGPGYEQRRKQRIKENYGIDVP